MTSFSEKLIAETLITQPSIFKRLYELRIDGELVATLKYPRLISQVAEVEGQFGNWEIYKPNFWKKAIAVRQKGYELPIAQYNPEWWGRGGTVELPLGAKLKHTIKLWQGIHEVSTESGQLVLTYHRKGWIGTAFVIQRHTQSELLDKYPWVLWLMWIAIQSRRQHAQ